MANKYIDKEYLLEQFKNYDSEVAEHKYSQSSVTVDSALNENSDNPVKNKAIKTALDDKQDKLIAGSNITINNSTNTISATNTNKIEDLLDVDISEPSNGQGLIYNSTTEQWENSTIQGGGGSYVLPTASTNVLGGVKIDGTTIVIDNNGTISTDGTYIKIQHENNLLVSSNERDYNVTIDITNGSDSNTSWTYDATTGLITVNGSLDPEEYTEIKICHFDGDEDYFLNYLKDKKVTLCGIPNMSDLDEYLDIEIYIDQYNNPQHYREINKNNSIIITEIEENEYDYDVYVKISNTMTGGALSGRITLNDLIICPCLTYLQTSLLLEDELELNGNVLDTLLGSKNLFDLKDVSIISPSDNDVLKYNATTEKWENGEGGSNTNVLSYDETLDVLGLPPNPIYKLRIATPVMTSNTTPSGVVSASGVSQTTYDAYKAFDGSESTRWTGTQNVTNHWLQYKFDDARVITKIEINAGAPNIQPTYVDMSVTIQGSNDGTNFTDLESDQILASDNLQYKTIIFDNETAYLYYRLQFTGYNVVYSGSWWTCIAEVKMYERYLA